MEEVLARIFQFSVALVGAFTVALWFALVIWTYRDAVLRSHNPLMQVFSTLIVVLFFVPGVIIYLLLRPRETLDERQQRWIEEEYLAQELDEISICPSCNHGVRDEWIYCPSCRFQLRRACQDCGRLVETGWEVCAFCGAELRLPATRGAESAAPLLISEGREQTVRSDSWIAPTEDRHEQLTTADGGAVLLESKEIQPNGTKRQQDREDLGETGELPSVARTKALESGSTTKDS